MPASTNLLPVRRGGGRKTTIGSHLHLSARKGLAGDVIVVEGHDTDLTSMMWMAPLQGVILRSDCTRPLARVR